MVQPMNHSGCESMGPRKLNDYHSHMQDWSAVIGSVYERIIEQLVQLLQNIITAIIIYATI